MDMLVTLNRNKVDNRDYFYILSNNYFGLSRLFSDLSICY